MSIEKLEENKFNFAAFQVQDQMNLANTYLSEEAKQALAKKASQLIVQLSEKNFARTVFLTCVTRKDRVEEGVKAISERLNELVEMGAVHSALTDVCSLDLAQMPFQHPNSVVLCYIHIKSEFYDEVESGKFSTKLGGLGPTLHSLDIDLPAGEFFGEAHISSWSPTRYNSEEVKTNEAMLYEEIQQHLRFLPEGTKFLGYRECPITDISRHYELKFFNPLLIDVKRVEFTYSRHAVTVGDSVKQFNLIMGLRYYFQDGRTLPE